ncbi:MAG: hypothetical protein LBG47_04760 [Prevotellaceae bacterium]|nr:hypothetical protein [Prevotellaceae bacterium]
MKMKKFFALMLMAAAASTVMVACDGDDDKDKPDTSIVGDYQGGNTGLKATYLGQTFPIPGVGWSIKALANDTILVTTDTISISMLNVAFSIKAYGKQEAADSVLYGAIAPVQNLTTDFGSVTLDSGTVSYRYANKTSFVSAAGSLYTVTDTTTTPPTYGSLPFAVTLTGAKK